jgi:hypothetical protein
MRRKRDGGGRRRRGGGAKGREGGGNRKGGGGRKEWKEKDRGSRREGERLGEGRRDLVGGMEMGGGGMERVMEGLTGEGAWGNVETGRVIRKGGGGGGK